MIHECQVIDNYLYRINTNPIFHRLHYLDRVVKIIPLDVKIENNILFVVNNTGIRCGVPAAKSFRPSDTDDGKGVLPDIEVHKNILEFAKDYIGNSGNKNKPAGK